MSVWSTSTVDLDVGKCQKNINSSRIYKRPHKCMMVPNGDGYEPAKYLSWRKLHLSRAKLKASSKTSALLSGFAMVAMVELQLSNDAKYPRALLVGFTVITTLLVAVHLLALMISTCILPNLDAICSLDSINMVEQSPHETLHWYIEIAWAFSTLLGLLLFLAEIAILCYIKFYDIDMMAAWSASVVLVPIFFVFLAFAVHFYRSLVAHKYNTCLQELESIKKGIDQVDMIDKGNGAMMNPVHIV